jgi:hypothetical protein
VYRWEYADALTGWPKAVLVVPPAAHGRARRSDDVVPPSMNEETKTHFLNLELRSKQEFTEPVQPFAPGALALSCMTIEPGPA